MSVILDTIFGVANIIIPRKGPKVSPIDIDFTVNNTIEVDATLLQQQDKMDVIQGAYIDNGDNPAALTITVGITRQRIVIKPYTQGYFPLLTVSPTIITFATPTAPSKKVRAIFYNVPIQGQNWATQ